MRQPVERAHYLAAKVGGDLRIPRGRFPTSHVPEEPESRAHPYAFPKDASTVAAT